MSMSGINLCIREVYAPESITAILLPDYRRRRNGIKQMASRGRTKQLNTPSSPRKPYVMQDAGKRPIFRRLPTFHSYQEAMNKYSHHQMRMR